MAVNCADVGPTVRAVTEPVADDVADGVDVAELVNWLSAEPADDVVDVVAADVVADVIVVVEDAEDEEDESELCPRPRPAAAARQVRREVLMLIDLTSF